MREPVCDLVRTSVAGSWVETSLGERGATLAIVDEGKKASDCRAASLDGDRNDPGGELSRVVLGEVTI